MNRIFNSLLRCESVSQEHSIVRRMAAAASGSSGDGNKFTNRLAREKSPYLLQHASNPVDWYPWGDEAFKAAREQNKLIFLSVGYSTCHWCHVMEKESFENEKVAAIMNEHFINVKVDREERPDVDRVYMNFVTSMSGSGGWPMSVWLTPDLHPVYGGTYFPPNNRYYGRPGFSTLLQALAKQWSSEEQKVRSSGTAIMSVLEKNLPGVDTAAGAQPDGLECANKCLLQLTKSYEAEYGGFSEAPKFPQVSNLNFLFAYYLLNPSTDDGRRAKAMALQTLTMMAQGGIHDHVSQGFARYSTDKQWHVPHFEKMLYDQAQLVHSYLDAYLVSRNELYRDVVRDILQYVLRDLSHESGGFYSAEDADSYPTADSKEKKEGAFCVWTKEEVDEVLGDDKVVEGNDLTLARLFCYHYSVMDKGNVDPYKDPHDELKNQNVLIAHSTVQDTAEEFELTVAQVKDALSLGCRKLFDRRQARPRPHLDDKMVTAWNGMMTSAVCRAGAVLSDPEYVSRGVQAAGFILKHLMSPEGRLYRAAYRDQDGQITLGPHKIEGFCDDYAWAVRAFISMYEATLDQEYLVKALELQETQDSLFWDTSSGGYFTTRAGDSSILMRMKDDHDGAEPSVNSVSAGNLLKLNRLMDKIQFFEKAQTIFKVFSERLHKIPVSLPEMAAVQYMTGYPSSQVILSGQRDSSVMKELISVVHNFPHPNRVILSAPPDKSAPLYGHQPSLMKYVPSLSAAQSSSEPASDSSQVLESAKAYVCHQFTCSLPMTRPEQLRENLEKAFKDAAAKS